MKISTLLNIHANPPIVLDTLESIQTFVGKEVLVLVDGAKWDTFVDTKFPEGVQVMKGFVHNYSRSPYRNITLGLVNLYERFPDSDFYCYTEYDCVFASDKYKDDLNGFDLIAPDVQRASCKVPLFEQILGFNPKQWTKMLGCCVFYSNQIIKTLYEGQFLQRILDISKGFNKGYFPDYKGYAFEEILFPTLINNLNGKIKCINTWRSNKKVWDNHDYLLRFRPDINEIINENAYVYHPLKDANSPVRSFLKKRRCLTS